MELYRSHVLVCGGTGCSSSGSAKLIERFEEQLKEKGSRCLTLEVRVSNIPAITLYEKLGFAEIGRRKNYYRNPREDALILRKEWDI